MALPVLVRSSTQQLSMPWEHVSNMAPPPTPEVLSRRGSPGDDSHMTGHHAGVKGLREAVSADRRAFHVGKKKPVSRPLCGERYHRMCVSKGIHRAMTDVTSGRKGLCLQNFYASVLLLFLILIM